MQQLLKPLHSIKSLKDNTKFYMTWVKCCSVTLWYLCIYVTLWLPKTIFNKNIFLPPLVSLFPAEALLDNYGLLVLLLLQIRLQNTVCQSSRLEEYIEGTQNLTSNYYECNSIRMWQDRNETTDGKKWIDLCKTGKMNCCSPPRKQLTQNYLRGNVVSIHHN